VRIIVDIRRGKDGRPTGTVRAADQSEVGSFSGNLEFWTLIEKLYQDDSGAEAGNNDIEED
jgi:hypothetical protein